MKDSLPVDRPLAEEIRDLNRFLIEVANLHLDYGKLHKSVKRRLAGHRDRISPTEIMPPGSGSHPGYVDELIGFLTADCSDDDAAYRLDRLWGALSAAVYIGQIDGLDVDPAKPARDSKASLYNRRRDVEITFIADFLGEEGLARAERQSLTKLLNSINAVARRKGFPDFTRTRLRDRLNEMRVVRD